MENKQKYVTYSIIIGMEVRRSEPYTLPRWGETEDVQDDKLYLRLQNPFDQRARIIRAL